jgi:hypothetical protein
VSTFSTIIKGAAFGRAIRGAADHAWTMPSRVGCPAALASAVVATSIMG